MKYHQFCPIAKALEVLGEKWTLLIVRELNNGSTRFTELQRGLPTMSPTLLSKRLAFMETHGLIFKQRIPDQRGYQYFPTQACSDLTPLLNTLGEWGVHWAKDLLTDDDFDMELLMFYLENSIHPQHLISNHTVIQFNFTDVTEFSRWWFVVIDDEVEACVQDPNKEVDVYINVSVKVMCQLFMGDISYRQAIANQQLQLLGPKALTSQIDRWIKISYFADVKPVEDVLISA